jgi:Carboxypeptidase regulatory-like domain
MQHQLLYIRVVVLGLVLLPYVTASSVDTCYKYHKRASVNSICGRIRNILGERPDGVELTLVNLTGSVLSKPQIDNQGKFIFEPVPKGDYLLRATAPGYLTVERELRVMHNQDKACTRRIEVTLGFRSCDGGTYVRGFDKKSDLFK